MAWISPARNRLTSESASQLRGHVYRLLIIVGLLVVLYFVLRSAIREFWGNRSLNRPAARQNDMVQDPVCRMYVPRRSALAATIGGQTYYFCSRDCAHTFERQLSG